MKYPPGFLDARPLIWSGYSVSPVYTYIIDLTPGVDGIWSSCSRELRRNVRKCEGKVTSREASPSELSDFLQVTRERYRDLGVRYPLTETYLSQLFRALGPSHIRLFVAGESENVQTGLILAMHGRRATIWHGSTRSQTSHLPINDHLHWFVTSWSVRHGFHECEFMDADNPRLEHFKSKFNPQPVPCFHAKRSRSWYRLAERIGRDPPSLF